MTAGEFGVIGLGVMGRNLALNIEEHGPRVAVWNYETDWIDPFLAEHEGKRLTGAKTLEALAAALPAPRRILMMIKAGVPVDKTLEGLAPHLTAGDVVIDGGNSHFGDTQRRADAMAKHGIRFMGMGVSGGEEGARHGPALMPGGEREAYEAARPVLEAIAAKTDHGPCVAWCGPDGAGHFVKMVHNGIEYGVMQLLAETYDLLDRVGGLSAPEQAELFAGWNRGPLESFLVDLTATVLGVVDPETSRPLVDQILDKAGQKGTGKWTAQAALDLGIAVPTIAAAIEARMLSALKDQRTAAEPSFTWDGAPDSPPDGLVEAARDALHAGVICSYAQGLALIEAASSEYGWKVDLREVARIWTGGCIIRARMLEPIMEACGQSPRPANLILAEPFRGVLQAAQEPWRRTVRLAQQAGIPVPALSSSLGYFDAYRTGRLPQNLTQAQRDAFGAHTYLRADDPDRGPVHTDWLGAREASS